MLSDESLFIRDNICGTGAVGAALMGSRHHIDELRPLVISVDEDPDALDAVEDLIRNGHCEDAWTCTSDPFIIADNVIDAAITIRQNSYYVNMKDNIQDVFRTVKPGGLAIFAMAPYPSYNYGRMPIPQE